MKTKKIIIAFFISISALLPLSAQALREVPKNEPLQPPPVNSQVNYSQSVNTPGSDINNTLQSQTPTEQTTQPAAADKPTPTPSQTAPIVGDVPTTSSTFYWFLLFVGLTGLVAIGLWAYFRFWRKR